MEDQHDCYYFKEIQISEGILDNVVECCYVLIMENSEREYDLMDRLTMYGYPCKNIIFQYNKGFKNCVKELKEQTSNYDIYHAYNNAFKHANEKKYNNILVLEEDFLFTDKINDENIVRDIENLFSNMEVNLFHLGPIFTIYNPLFLLIQKYNCIKGFLTPLSHGVIYSKKFYKKYLETYRLKKFKTRHIDINFNSFFIDGIYTHNQLLCIQPLTDTENSQNWGSSWLVYIFKKIIRFFELDSENPIKGFKKVRIINYMLNFIVYALSIYLFILLIKI